MLRREEKCQEKDILQKEMYYQIQCTIAKVVTKLINNIMEDGKRGVAQKICYEAFELIAEKTGKDPLEVFEDSNELI